MIFHLFRIWLSKIFGSHFESSHKTYKLPTGGFRSIGGGTDHTSRKGRGPTSTDQIIGLTFTESEERMMEGVKMQSLQPYPAPISGQSSCSIVVSKQVNITHETRGTQ